MTGTAGQLRVPLSFLKETEIPVPPTKEQIRIVAKLEKLLAKADCVTGGIPVVNPTHINGGAITPSSEMAVSPQKAQQLSDHRIIKLRTT